VRPIEKGPVPPGNPPPYPYDVNLGSDAALAQSLGVPPAPAWPFTQQAVKALYNNQGSLSPLQALIALLVIAGGVVPPPPLNLARRAKAALNYRVSKEYQKAAAPLGDRIGKFCCYCDQALPGQIAVEHVLPKAPYPMTSIAWGNFLLACEVCNSNKGDRPSRAEMNGWGVQLNEEVQRYAAMRAYYLWPDTSPAVFTGYRPELYYYETGNNEWEPVPAQGAIGGRLLSSVLSTRTVKAWLPGLAVPSVEVRVTMDPAGANPAAQHSDELLGLWKNGTEQGGGKISDTRMFNRTLAWFRVQKFLGPAIAAANAAQQPSFEERWEAVLAAAPAIGHFPVWLRLLEFYNASQVNVPGANPAVNVWNHFLQTTNVNGVFPNTRPVGV
jgi:hypothetical protein